jgi:hypothetical protein
MGFFTLDMSMKSQYSFRIMDTNSNEIKCIVCGRKRTWWRYPGKKYHQWAVEIEVANPQPGEPETISLCPKHRKMVWNEVISDRISRENGVKVENRVRDLIMMGNRQQKSGEYEN